MTLRSCLHQNIKELQQHTSAKHAAFLIIEMKWSNNTNHSCLKFIIILNPGVKSASAISGSYTFSICFLLFSQYICPDFFNDSLLFRGHKLCKVLQSVFFFHCYSGVMNSPQRYSQTIKSSHATNSTAENMESAAFILSWVLPRLVEDGAVYLPPPLYYNGNGNTKHSPAGSWYREKHGIETCSISEYETTHKRSFSTKGSQRILCVPILKSGRTYHENLMCQNEDEIYRSGISSADIE